MTFRQLEYICALAEEGNVSRAARRLCISQPALSRQIMLVERELETRLLDRSKTPLKLTPAGQMYLEAAREILDIRKSLLRRIKPGIAGKTTLTVRAAPLYMNTVMPFLLDRFKTEYPGIRFSLQETLYPAGEDAHPQEESGLRVCGLPLPSEIYDYQPLFTERILLAVPSAHPQAEVLWESAGPGLSDLCLPFIHLSRLRECVFAVPRTSARLRNMTLELCREAGFEPDMHAADSMLYSILTLLPATGFVALVPETAYAYSNYHNPQLRYYMIESPAAQRTMAAAYSKNRELSAQERLFIVKSREYLGG